jgi:O-methyltransferase
MRRAAVNRLRQWFRADREWLSRQILFDTVTGFVQDCRIEGDYLEFGCGRGGSLIDMYDAARRHHLDLMRFYTFDSFQGLPESAGLDAGESLRYEKGDYACDLDNYRSNLRRGGVDLGRVTCVPGWYADSLTTDLKTRLPLKVAAIVLVDCDLYESTVPVLNFLTSYVQTGTVVIFDDWFSFKGREDRGEARAFHEWLARNPSLKATEYHKVGRTMMSFIMSVD